MVHEKFFFVANPIRIAKAKPVRAMRGSAMCVPQDTRRRFNRRGNFWANFMHGGRSVHSSSDGRRMSACPKDLPFFLRCKMSLMALNSRADWLPSCPVLGAWLPRQPLRVAAVDDPER